MVAYKHGIVTFTKSYPVQGVPGTFYNRFLQCWQAVASPYTLVALANLIPEEAWGSDFRSAVAVARAELALLTESWESVTPSLALPLRKHQVAAFQFAFPRRGALLALDMGTGKTAVTIALLFGRKHTRTLIVAPKSCIPVWPKELAKFATAPYDLLALHEHTRGKKETVAKKARVIGDFLAHAQTDTAIVVMNYETLWRPLMADVLLASRFDCVVADECDHAMLGPQGKVSKYMEALGMVTPYRLGLTGTPVTDKPLDAFGQLRFIEPGIFGFGWTRFKDRYAVQDPYTFKYTYINQEEFAERLGRVTTQVRRRDVLDLPPVEHVTRYGYFSDSRPYEELVKEFVTFVADTEVTADNALVKALRLQQMTSGYVMGDAGEAVEWDSAKRSLLKETLTAIPADEPTVVFCWFTHDLQVVRTVASELGRPYGECSGARNDLVDAAYPPGVSVLGVQMRAGGRGVDFSASAYGIFYSKSYANRLFEQALARQDRHGQTRPVTYYHLEIAGTIDQAITRALREKADVCEYILALARTGVLTGDDG